VEVSCLRSNAWFLNFGAKLYTSRHKVKDKVKAVCQRLARAALGICESPDGFLLGLYQGIIVVMRPGL